MNDGCESVRACALRDVALLLVGHRRRFRVSGSSMEPLLSNGDEVLLDPRAYRRGSPVAGDLVVARHPYRRATQILKRVASVDTTGHCELRGDNPAASTDSRSFGAVPLDAVVGKVVARF